MVTMLAAEPLVMSEEDREVLALTEHWNDNPKPFIWTKTAEAIMNKQQ